MEKEAYLGTFWLPPDSILFYDDPQHSPGDENWTMESLSQQVSQDGEILSPLQIGRSAWALEHESDVSVFAFNGNHRLAVAKDLGLPWIPCEASAAEDAVPLTRADILALGGVFAKPEGMAAKPI